MPMLYGRQWSRLELESRIGEFSQIAGVTLVTLGDGAARGVRTLQFRTGSGLEFWILIDRAFDIARFIFQGAELGWQSPVGIRGPWLHENNDEGGVSFLRSFSGFLVTCGLDHAFAARRDPGGHYFSGDRMWIDQPLHGRITASPGQLIGYGHEWRGDRCVLYCEGIVRQAAVFGEHLELHRRYEVDVGTSSVTMRDRIRNHSFYRTPHMMLYHVNLGFPLLDEGVEFLAPSQRLRWSLRDSREEGIGHRFQSAPRIGCFEQVFVHDLVADCNGRTCAALLNRRFGEGAGLGLAVEFNQRQLPYLLQWQNFQAGSYCVAIEPSTTHPLGRPHAAANGDMDWLDHGDERLYELRFEAINGKGDICMLEQFVRGLQPDVLAQFSIPTEGFGQ
jgi:hypothetical protein